MGVGKGVGSGRLENVRLKPVFMTGIPWGWYVSVWSAGTSPRKKEIVWPVREALADTDRDSYLPWVTMAGFDS